MDFKKSALYWISCIRTTWLCLLDLISAVVSAGVRLDKQPRSCSGCPMFILLWMQLPWLCDAAGTGSQIKPCSCRQWWLFASMPGNVPEHHFPFYLWILHCVRHRTLPPEYYSIPFVFDQNQQLRETALLRKIERRSGDTLIAVCGVVSEKIRKAC